MPYGPFIIFYKQTIKMRTDSEAARVADRQEVLQGGRRQA